MKNNIILTLFIFLLMNSYTQDLTYEMVKKQTKQQIKVKDLPTFESYTTKEGTIFKVGDHLELGSSKNATTFKTIYLYKSQYSMQLLPHTYQNKKYKIIEIASANNTVSITLETGFTGVLKNFTIRTFDLESSLLEGEIKHNGITSDEALENLKKAKDKLDLGLITQEEYDNIKNDLKQYIK